MRQINFDFEVKSKTKDGIVVEGFANAATIDRMKEKIDPNGWNLDNYKKNPVVLFDHGHDPTFGYMPIGKALSVEARPEGLYTKIQLSGSKSEKISAIRDLVEEGILKTFSVGFDPKETEKSADNPDITIIKSAELIETSIVPIPMNQDSTFSVLRKKFNPKNDLAKKWLEGFCGKLKLVKKGAWVAAAIHQRLYDLLETGEIRDKDAALKFIGSEANATMGEVKAVLSGDMTPVPPKLLQAFSTVLRVDYDHLVNLDKGDLDLLDKIMSRQEGERSMTEVNTKADPISPPADGQPPADQTPPADQQAPEDDMGKKLIIHSVVIPKDIADTPEAAQEIAKQNGYKFEQVAETDSGWVLPQVDAPLPEGDQQVLDLGNGVMAVVVEMESALSATGKAMGDTPPASQAPSADQAPPADQQPEFAEEDKKKWADAFAADVKATQEGGPGNPAPWVADEALWEKAKRASEHALGDISYPFVVWWYLNQGGGRKSGEANETKSIAEQSDDNPYLELSRQSNLLLGTLVTEIQKMSGKLDGIADLSLAKAKEVGNTTSNDSQVDQNTSEDVTKSYDYLLEYQRDLDRKLKRMGIAS